MYARDADELIPLLGHRVRVRNGRHTFVGRLNGPSSRKFSKGLNSSSYGLVVEGDGYHLEFAWWDWYVEPMMPMMMAAE